MVAKLKSAMVPGEDEPEDVQGMSTRSELVKRIEQADADVTAAAEESFANAIAQLRLVNPGIDLIEEGTHFMNRVVDGKMVVPAWLNESPVDDQPPVRQPRDDEHMANADGDQAHTPTEDEIFTGV